MWPKINICRFFLVLTFMVGCCNNNSLDGDFIPQAEERSCKTKDENKKNQETVQKTEVETKTVQPPHLRFPRFPDVSIFTDKISRQIVPASSFDFY